jgi:hypothetical protein
MRSSAELAVRADARFALVWGANLFVINEIARKLMKLSHSQLDNTQVALLLKHIDAMVYEQWLDAWQEKERNMYA